MNKLLYYPHFEVQDETFLKFALLYIDEIKPIIPVCAMDTLSRNTQDILTNTSLISPYVPEYTDGELASKAAILYLENLLRKKADNRDDVKIITGRKDYLLYSDKYTYEFEQYCIESGVGSRCDNGIVLGRNIAFAYMSILAEIISHKTELDMITDNLHYSDSILRNTTCYNRKKLDRLDVVQKELQFQIPVDVAKIPLEKFIELRKDDRFDNARKCFVAELNNILDKYDMDIMKVDLYDFFECKNEITRLIGEVFGGLLTMAMAVRSLKNMYVNESRALDFFADFGSSVASIEKIKQRWGNVNDYIEKIGNKKLARKYLTRLNRLSTDIL